MKSQTFYVGLKFSVPVSEILFIRAIGSAPVKRQIAEMCRAGVLQDATCGKKMRTLVCLKNGYGIISPIQQETLDSRYNETFK